MRRSDVALKRLHEWWWPGFVFIYPLLWSPWTPGRQGAYAIHIWFAVGALLGAVALSLRLDARSRLRDIFRRTLKSMVRLPALLTLGFAGWAWVAAALSPDPGIALTGSLTESSNGAYEFLILGGIFLLVYGQVRHESGVARRIAWAVALSGLVLAGLAVLEALTLHGAIQGGIAVTDLPMVNFPGKGHLAGMLALSAGIAIAHAAPWLVLLLATGIGLTLNRASMIAMLPGLLFVKPRRIPRMAVIALTVVVGLGLGIMLAQRPQMHPTKEVASGSSLVSRSFLYRAAIRGILARPVVGWGGGVFELHWTDYLSRAELSKYVEHHFRWGPVLKVFRSPGGYPVLLVSDWTGTNGQTSKVGIVPFTIWHSHNQFLEVGLQAGIVGMVLYLWLLYLGLRGLRNGNPLSLGLLAYFLFLQFWFVIPETRSVLWVVWAAAVATSEPASAMTAAATESSESSGSVA